MTTLMLKQISFVSTLTQWSHPLLCVPKKTRRRPTTARPVPTNYSLSAKGMSLARPLPLQMYALPGKGISEIHFNDRKPIVHLKHGKHSLPHIHSASTFIFDRRQYYWEGHSELYRRDGDGLKLIAGFYPAMMSG